MFSALWCIGYQKTNVSLWDVHMGHASLLRWLCTFFIQCNRGKSLDAFFDDFLLQPDSVKIALIGCGCSVATEPVAEISHKWNISQVPYMQFVLVNSSLSLSNICLLSSSEMVQLPYTVTINYTHTKHPSYCTLHY